MARMLEKYRQTVRTKLMERFKYNNIHQAPGMEKIVINMGVGRASQDKGILEDAVRDLTLIAGQRPVRNKAKNAVASFKIREGMPIGCKVTLRGERMFEFFDRLVTIALPAVKDFRGVPGKFDGRGNFTLGWTDHTLFPEVRLDDVKNTFGMDVCIVTSANSDQEGLALLEELGMPFRKN